MDPVASGGRRQPCGVRSDVEVASRGLQDEDAAPPQLGHAREAAAQLRRSETVGVGVGREVHAASRADEPALRDRGAQVAVSPACGGEVARPEDVRRIPRVSVGHVHSIAIGMRPKTGGDRVCGQSAVCAPV